ncbi:MAG: 50S ribosomal protein L2 [Candidatus Diapherotrites archaeon]|nr:50S ribosomal protein L2 [Candidatus Diapherotrites archaeon]
MGKRIRAQRLGKGGPPYKARKLGRIDVKYANIHNENIKGQIIELLKEPARDVVVAKVRLENGKDFYMLAPEGVFEGENIEIGENAEISLGNILPLKNIPEGCPVFNIEIEPGDGGKLVRSSGGYALLVEKRGDKAVIKMPSGKSREIPVVCYATIGCLSCGERVEKPFVKAGKAYHHYRAKGKKSFRVRGVAMNPIDHPFGGSQHHVGKSKSVKRGAPPGRKVGQIAAKRTGRRKK